MVIKLINFNFKIEYLNYMEIWTINKENQCINNLKNQKMEF